MIKFSLGTFCYLFLSLTTSAYGALIYTPSNLKADKANLVVVVHGCLQSPESMALGTGTYQKINAPTWVSLKIFTIKLDQHKIHFS